MLNKSNFVQLSIGLAVVALVVVGYAALVRKPNGDASYASKRNAAFLNLKNAVAADQNSLANSGDLSIDGDFGSNNVTVDDSSNGNTVTPDNGSTPQPSDDQKPDETSAPDTATATAGDKAATVYTVKPGDTYGCIAEKYYGSYEHWTDIYNANARYGLGFQPDELFVDAKLDLPAIAAADLKPASKLCE